MKGRVLPLALVIAAIACNKSSPSQPTQNPTTTVTTTVPPTQQTPRWNLSGTVTETPPTTSRRLANATVRIVDGPNAGQQTTSGGDGSFTFVGLEQAGFTVVASLDGYQQASTGVNLTANRSVDLRLNPNPITIHETFTGQLSGGDSTCSDGLFTKPCKRVNLPVHNRGTIDGQLEWTGGCNDLDLGLWSSGGSQPIAKSDGVTGREHVSANVPGGGYEFRITYYDGCTIANYTLTVERPN